MKKEKINVKRLLYKLYMCFGTILFASVAVILSLSSRMDQFSFGSRLEQLDLQVSDFIYQVINYRLQEDKVTIIAIDDKTVAELGEFDTWSRSRTAELIELLNGMQKAPRVIGIGLDYSGNKDEQGDSELIDVCKEYDNICFSSYIFTENVLSPQKSPLSIIPNENETDGVFVQENLGKRAPIVKILQPYEELMPYVSSGIINNLQIAEDGYARTVVTSVTHDNTEYDGFAVTAYKMYQKSIGEEVKLPRVDEENAFSFVYSRKSNDYAIYSFCDVILGKTDMSVFEDGIVLIGDYTSKSNMFNVPNQKNEQMQYIEVQANILDALLSQRTGQLISYSYMSGFYALFAIIFFIATSYSSSRRTVLTGAVLILFQLLMCALANACGYYILILIPSILIVTIMIFNLTIKYIVTKYNNYRLEHVFKKYVDKHIVDEIVQTGNIGAHVGGIKKDIAVLFVDIRGYTTLSERLLPEQVVSILNKYLSLVERAIAKNEGTVDKFIGDAAMAVFNSPLDVVDYEYKAVCAAWDILQEAKQLEEFCKKNYDKSVTFGIGIHCGDAITGNIGCESRMDYTAIGDTVNTASRLESIAAKGQILISEEMKLRLGCRIQTSYGGEVVLKGKKNKVPVYILEGITELQDDDSDVENGISVEKNTRTNGQLYCIPSIKELDKYAEFAKKYNAAFEYNDFFIPQILDDAVKKKEIMAQYMSLDRDRSNDTLHGAFLDIAVNSSDPHIFEISNKRVRQSMDIAKKMGVKAVIFHTNYIVNFRLQSYLNDWLERNEKYWRKILWEYPDQCIYLENMFDDTPYLLTALAERMKNEHRFGVCLDVAHAYISGSKLNSWFEYLTPYVTHLHLNDNNQHEDLHSPIGRGSFPWEEFENWIKILDKKPSALIEVRSFEDLQNSVEYMKKHKIYPFDTEDM